ncbi:DUF1841 family protein [Dactylosporangium cerinum]|uniref:DUF1841 family protein n=1 Tax=Dactylosporangium cerinum TaxID=1434730 RepID=A0ABV9VLC8_9ACTN
MSPVSRGRKTKKTRARRGAPSLASVHAEMVRSFQVMTTEGEPLDVEVFTSDLVGAWWHGVPPDEGSADVIGLGAVQFGLQQGTPAAQAMLRAFAAVAATPELREAADAGANALAERGVADPPWAESIGRAEVGECLRLSDVYGDQTSIYCEFRYGSDRHALAVLLDSDPVGWVSDAWITNDPDELFAGVRQQAADDPELTVLDRIDPAEARRMIEEGIVERDAVGDLGPIGEDEDEVPESFREFRALALARCRVMPEPAPVADPVEVPEPERARLVEEFLGSAEAKELPDTPETRSCARVIVDFGADFDEGRPLRVSPAKVEMFVHDWLPDEELDNEVVEAMPAVLVAWTRWAGERSQLPAAAVTNVVEQAEGCAGHLVETYDDIDAEPYLADVDEDSPEAEAVLERRLFAVPQLSTLIGDDDYIELDPADPDARDVLILGEHPEWHEVLSGPSVEGSEVDGVNPRLHLAMHAVVTNQLWDNDPQETWLAAQRLLAAGVDRHDILHQLANVAIDHLHASLASGQPADMVAYRKSLNALGGRKARRLRW